MVDNKQEDVVIRTMKDDLALDASKSQSFAGPPPPTPKTPTSKPKNVADGKAPQKDVDVKSAPKKQVAPKKKGGGALIKVVGGLVAVLVLGGVAFGAWWYFFAGGGSEATPNQSGSSVATATEMIPTDASIVLRYQADTPNRRSLIEQFWGDQSADTTLSALIEGNPTAVLADQSVSDVLYIVLEGNVRPFAVFPKSNATANLVAQQSRVQVLEYQGWYIAHPINSNQLIESLRVGSVAVNGGLPPLQNNEIAQLIVKPRVLALLQDSVSVYADLLPEAVTQIFSLEYDGADDALIFKNRNSGTLATTSPAIQQLISLIPGDVESLFIGSNFAQIAPSFGVEAPAELALINDLSAPYGYYKRDGADAIFDAGAIAAIPEPLQGTLNFDDPVIEQLSQTLVPVLAGGDSLANLSFVADFYREVPLRFVNINQTATESVDYTISDDFVFLASSKEGMYALIDTLLSDKESIETTSPWQELMSLAGGVSASSALSLGTISFSPILELLPSGAQQALPYVLIVDSGAPEFIHGALSLSPL